MFEKLKDLKEAATAAVGTGIEKAQGIMREFNESVPILQALSLSVRNTSFGMGIVPEIRATLVGSIDALDCDKIGELLKENQKNQTATFILEALRTASRLKDQLSVLKFRGVKVDLKLGIPPNVEVALLSETDSD